MKSFCKLARKSNEIKIEGTAFQKPHFAPFAQQAAALVSLVCLEESGVACFGESGRALAKPLTAPPNKSNRGGGGNGENSRREQEKLDLGVYFSGVCLMSVIRRGERCAERFGAAGLLPIFIFSPLKTSFSPLFIASKPAAVCPACPAPRGDALPPSAESQVPISQEFAQEPFFLF